MLQSNIFSIWTCVLLSERNSLRDLARSKSKFWVEFSECQAARGKGHPALGYPFHSHCLWGIEVPIWLRSVQSSWIESLSMSWLWALLWWALSQLFPCTWGMEDPKGPEGWNSLASLQHHSGNTEKSETLSSVSKHAKQPCSLQCSHAMPGIGNFSKASLFPVFHLGIETQASYFLKLPNLLEDETRVWLQGRGTGVSALLLPSFMSQIIEWGKEPFLFHEISSVYRFCKNTVLWVLQALVFEA